MVMLTMSLFVAGQAFSAEDDFAAAKLGVFASSLLAACVGAALLWRNSTKTVRRA
jgi:NhaA family Na+:H+ antiporter